MFAIAARGRIISAPAPRTARAKLRRREMSMSSRQALQDRFRRNVVFVMRVNLDDGLDPLGAMLGAIRSAGARTGELHMVEHRPGVLVYDVQVFAANLNAASGADALELRKHID